MTVAAPTVPASMLDLELELDVLTSITREPYRAARLFVTLKPAAFGFGPHRYLYVALRRLEWPAARWLVDEGAVRGRWHVEGLTEALAMLPAAGDPERAVERLYDALESNVPLVPFYGRLVGRLEERARRRTVYLEAALELHDAASRAAHAGTLNLADLDHGDRLLAAYAGAELAEDVTGLEHDLEALITKAAAW